MPGVGLEPLKLLEVGSAGPQVGTLLELGCEGRGAHFLLGLLKSVACRCSLLEAGAKIGEAVRDISP